ncbi:hypothetical protein PSHT_10020 [Puccinia striiformis]|uniref:Uncharacterized protein n=2 Tax=Puccinia striiformis TaxID=27350 RepID=A0A2S4VCJ3_9BASI|nr:hypothetical protein PSHT_10020 [Puccinia striiformis]
MSKPPVALAKSTSTATGLLAPIQLILRGQELSQTRQVQWRILPALHSIKHGMINCNLKPKTSNKLTKPKKPTRPKKTTKPSQPMSVVGSETEDNRPVRQTNLNQSQQQMLVTSETIVPGEDSKVVEEEIITTKMTRLPGKKKTQLSQTTIIKSGDQLAWKNQDAKRTTSEGVKSPPAAEPVSKVGELSQESVPVPEGWLANSYNPSQPFPPLTSAEKTMPPSQYFAYRAHQEEQAFLEWVERYQLRPWLDSVKKGRLIVQNLIEVWLSSSDSIAKLALGSHDQSSGHKENLKVLDH